MIRCVCLVVEKEGQLLLVQARNRAKYYFPGGKIEDEETQINALVREVKEELGIQLQPHALRYINTVVGPAYPQENEWTELNCYRTDETVVWEQLQPAAEITDLSWVDITNKEQIAPAVLEWVKQSQI